MIEETLLLQKLHRITLNSIVIMDSMELRFDLVPEGGRSAFHLPNADDEDFRRVLAQTTNASSPLNVTVRLVELHHGKMMHEQRRYHATLLLLEIRFQSSLQERRYKSANITVEFFDQGGNDRRDPHVMKLAPDRMHWLNKTTYDQTTSRGASLGVQAGMGGVGADAAVHWDAEYTKPKKFKATLTGRSHHSDGRKVFRGENAVTWTMQENEDECEGVPSFLQTAVLLMRPENALFFAKLRVKSNVDFITRLRRALPFTTDQDKIIDPVVFTPASAQVRNSSITRITEQELENMHDLPISKYFKINMSEEDPLTPPTTEDVTGEPAQHPDTGSPITKTAPLGSDLAAPQLMMTSEETRGVGAVCSKKLSIAAAVTKAAEAAQAAARAAASAAEAAIIARAAAETAALAAAEAASLVAADAESYA